VETAVRLRPVRADDLWLFERYAVDPAALGEFNWSGFQEAGAARRQFDEDGFLGADRGHLIVDDNGAVAGAAAWRRHTYGLPQWWCWSIGASLLPDFRGRGIGTAAQAQLVAYLFDTTAAERLEAFTDVDNVAEQRSLSKAGLVREGVVRGAQFRQGRWRDLYLYSVLRRDRD
jgi:RimJ/RimL family protein N-acetyltransferase